MAATHPPVEMRIRGVDEIVATLPRFGEKVMAASVVPLRVAAEQTADETRIRLPRKTGRLAGSVRVANRKGRRQRVSMGRAKVPYAGWIEFGGNRPHPRPFISEGRYLFPAAERHRAPLKHDLEKQTEHVIRRYQWPKP